MKKHLVYAEDFIYDIMQYPNANVSKGEIHARAERFLQTNTITVWQHLRNCIKWLFRKS